MLHWKRFFSLKVIPNKTTKLILESIAEGFGSTNHQHLDATYSDVSKNETFSEDEICVIGSPAQATSASNPSISDENKCISCCACIKECPAGARSMDDERIVQIINRLATNSETRKEPIIIV